MNILLMSAGGGGGNILRSLKRLFRRDLIVAQKTSPKFAARLQRSIVTRFLDTNAFSLSDVPAEERVLIGPRTTRRLGSMHNPVVAKDALEESKQDVEALLAKYSVVILIGTGGKGTGAGTMLPLARMTRELGKLVLPIFVMPSFERHEVEKPRYDHALSVVRGFDSAGIRLIEILNDCGYVEQDPQPQSVVWERMNLPIARALRGLLYVLSDLSQVDPSDLSLLFAGGGRLRIGFAEVDPVPGREPGEDHIDKAVRECWDNPYCAFEKPVGSSLICIQGDWSNLVDGKIKSRLAARAMDGTSENTYNPLYARAFHTPRPWGITAVFAEYTGEHQPLEIEWPWQRKPAAFPYAEPEASEALVVNRQPDDIDEDDDEEQPQPAVEPVHLESKPVFAKFSDLAVAIHRSDPSALAAASDKDGLGIPVEAVEVRRLLGTLWFPSVFRRLSTPLQEKLLDRLIHDAAIPNHVLKVGRSSRTLREIHYDDLKEIHKRTYLPEAVQADVQFLVAVGTLWGPDAPGRLPFLDLPGTSGQSMLGHLLQAFRGA
jgi:cell division GTPase FtsZ